MKVLALISGLTASGDSEVELSTIANGAIVARGIMLTMLLELQFKARFTSNGWIGKLI